jgi:hypothetical protein
MVIAIEFEHQLELEVEIVFDIDCVIVLLIVFAIQFECVIENAFAASVETGYETEIEIASVIFF